MNNNIFATVSHQGKTIEQWEKAFDGEFTAEQLLKMARGGADLIKILSYKDGAVNDIYETDKSSIDDPALFKGEEFYFNESAQRPEDVLTVDDLNEVLARTCDNDDKVMFRVNKQECSLFDIHSKGGIAVIDLVKGKFMSESIDYDEWQEAADWFNANGYELEDDESRLDSIAPQMDQFLFKVGCSPANNDRVLSGNEGWNLYKKLSAQTKINESITDKQWEEAAQWFAANGYDIHDSDEGGFTFTQEVEGKKWYDQDEGWNLYLKLSGKEKNTDMSEGYSWRRGGYGGTGRSYSSLGGTAPRGAAIGWYAVDVLDPKAKGNIAPGWRCGPSNFRFTDLLYPERKYKVGTMVMRNKYVKAGSMSGEKYIAIPSYFDAIKNNDEEALNILKLLGIPLNLTFGMDPDDDYTVTYN